MKMLFRVFLLIALAVAVTSQAQPNNCYTILDLCVVIDASKSTCASDPTYKKQVTTCDYWKSILNFTHYLVSSLNVGPDATRVGVVLYATKGHRVFNMTRFMDLPSLLNQIDGQEYTAGYTNISGGMEVMMNLVYQPGYGDRPEIQNVALIFTSGSATDPSTVDPSMKSVHDNGITTIAIGGNGATESSVKQLASAPQQINQTYFMVHNFLSLSQILNQVQTQICYGSAAPCT